MMNGGGAAAMARCVVMLMAGTRDRPSRSRLLAEASPLRGGAQAQTKAKCALNSKDWEKSFRRRKKEATSFEE